MTDAPTPTTPYNVATQGNALLVPLMIQPQSNDVTLWLAGQDNKVRLQVPRAAMPFGQPGQIVTVTLGLVLFTIEPVPQVPLANGLILPGGAH